MRTWTSKQYVDPNHSMKSLLSGEQIPEHRAVECPVPLHEDPHTAALVMVLLPLGSFVLKFPMKVSTGR
jgi:hypothetical protein